MNLKDYIESQLIPINAFLEETLGELHPLVRPLAEHTLMAGGKRLRPVLVLLFFRLTGQSGSDPYPLASALELFHTATLIHDDILDNSELRRSKEATHLVFGVRESVLAGDVLLGVANRIVAGYNDPALVDRVSEAILMTASGEILEIDAARKADLDRDEYIEMIVGKTGFLIQAACECGAILGGGSSEQQLAAREFGRNLGIAFQLVDDVMDYTSCAGTTGKPLGGDLREGKMTLPLLFYLESLSSEERDIFSGKLAADSFEESEIEEVIRAISKDGHAAKARAVAEGYLRDSLQNLGCFASGQEIEVLRQMVVFLKNRDR